MTLALLYTDKIPKNYHRNSISAWAHKNLINKINAKLDAVKILIHISSTMFHCYPQLGVSMNTITC